MKPFSLLPTSTHSGRGSSFFSKTRERRLSRGSGELKLASLLKGKYDENKTPRFMKRKPPSGDEILINKSIELWKKSARVGKQKIEKIIQGIENLKNYYLKKGLKYQGHTAQSNYEDLSNWGASTKCSDRKYSALSLLKNMIKKSGEEFAELKSKENGLGNGLDSRKVSGNPEEMFKQMDAKGNKLGMTSLEELPNVDLTSTRKRRNQIEPEGSSPEIMSGFSGLMNTRRRQKTFVDDLEEPITPKLEEPNNTFKFTLPSSTSPAQVSHSSGGNELSAFDYSNHLVILEDANEQFSHQEIDTPISRRRTGKRLEEKYDSLLIQTEAEQTNYSLKLNTSSPSYQFGIKPSLAWPSISKGFEEDASKEAGSSKKLAAETSVEKKNMQSQDLSPIQIEIPRKESRKVSFSRDLLEKTKQTKDQPAAVSQVPPASLGTSSKGRSNSKNTTDSWGDKLERKFRNFEAYLNSKEKLGWNRKKEDQNASEWGPREERLIFSDTEAEKTKKLRSKYDASQTGTIGVEDFDFLATLGKGGFGSVWLVKRKATEDLYAMKIIKFHNKDPDFIQNMVKENDIMMNLVGDYVVKGVFSFIHNRYYCVVMDLMVGGDFRHILNEQSALYEDDVKFYAAELVLAVNHIHKQQITHRDLKPENILLDNKGHLKLADFGLSNQIKEEEENNVRSSKVSTE